MTAVVRAARFRRWQRRTVLPAGLVTVVVAGVTAALVVTLAPDGAAGQDPTALVTTDGLELAGGGTAAFTLLGSFSGLAVLVLVAVGLSTDAARGTLRTLLLHHPGRTTMLGAKLVATVATITAILLLAVVSSWVVSWIAARATDVDTSACDRRRAARRHGRLRACTGGLHPVDGAGDRGRGGGPVDGRRGRLAAGVGGAVRAPRR